MDENYLNKSNKLAIAIDKKLAVSLLASSFSGLYSILSVMRS